MNYMNGQFLDIFCREAELELKKQITIDVEKIPSYLNNRTLLSVSVKVNGIKIATESIILKLTDDEHAEKSLISTLKLSILRTFIITGIVSCEKAACQSTSL